MSKRYETEKELRAEVERRLRGKIPEDIWEEIKIWDYPYDNYDVKDITNKLKSKIVPKSNQKRNIRASEIRAEIVARAMESRIKDGRKFLFGNPDPPLRDVTEMVKWIKSEAANQPIVDSEATSKNVLDYPDSNGRVRSVVVYEGTLLHKLWKHVRVRAKEIGCQEAQATEFILTGELPIVSPLSWSYSPPSRYEAPFYNPFLGEITLTIREPVNDKEVVKQYKKLRKIVWGDHRNRKSINERDAELVKAVIDWRRGYLKPSDPLRWPEIKTTWNRKYPKWRFDHWRYLEKAFRDAYAKIYPGIKWRGLDPHGIKKQIMKYRNLKK